MHKAVTLRDQGKSLDEVAEWVKNNRLHLVHVFTVDDLYHLYRGVVSAGRQQSWEH